MFYEFIQKIWKGVALVASILVTVGIITAYDNKIAKSADLEKVKKANADAIAQAELKTDVKFTEFKKTMDLDRDIARMNQVNAAITQIRLLLKTHPKDKDLQDDLVDLKVEKSKLQERIDKR